MKNKVQIKEYKVGDYILGVPVRLKDIMNPTKIKINVSELTGEYMYFPGKYSFWQDTELTSEELRVIADKIDELNEE